MNSLTAADQARISYRQVDYWIRQGYIRAGCPGSGYQRDLPGHEVEVLKHMADLVRAGFTPQVAARIGRQFAEGLGTEIRLGIYRLVREQEPQASLDPRVLADTA